MMTGGINQLRWESLDILENNIYNNINGYIVSENIYLNKGKIFKVYTDLFQFTLKILKFIFLCILIIILN